MAPRVSWLDPSGRLELSRSVDGSSRDMLPPLAAAVAAARLVTASIPNSLIDVTRAAARSRQCGPRLRVEDTDTEVVGEYNNGATDSNVSITMILSTDSDKIF